MGACDLRGIIPSQQKELQNVILAWEEWVCGRWRDRAGVVLRRMTV